MASDGIIRETKVKREMPQILGGLDPEKITLEETMGILRPLPVYKRIPVLRLLHQISQTTLAGFCGVTRGTVVAWEMMPHQKNSRAHGPGADQRHMLAMVFGVPAFVFTPDYGMRNFDEVEAALLKKRGGKVPRKRGNGGRPKVNEPRAEQEAEARKEEEKLARKEERAKKERGKVTPPPPGVVRIG